MREKEREKNGEITNSKRRKNAKTFNKNFPVGLIFNLVGFLNILYVCDRQLEHHKFIPQVRYKLSWSCNFVSHHAQKYENRIPRFMVIPKLFSDLWNFWMDLLQTCSYSPLNYSAIMKAGSRYKVIFLVFFPAQAN